MASSSPLPAAASAAPTDPADAERLTLLNKAQAAFAAGPARGQDERAGRVLQRLWRLTDEASLQGAASAAAVTRGASVIPVVAPAPTPAREEQAGDSAFTLPLLAPELHAAAAAAAASATLPALPTAQHPPLFLIFNNLGLVHLRAGRVAVSMVFFARALEHSQQLLASLAPAATHVAASPDSHTRGLRLPHSSALSPDGRLLSPPSGLLSPQRSTSPVSLQQHAGSGLSPSPSPPPAATGGPSLYAFLLSKSLDVHYNTGVALMLRHSHSAVNEAAACTNEAAWASTPTCEAVQLAVRCFQHCMQLPLNPAWASLPTAVTAAASQKLLYCPVRLGECLLLLHRCTAAVSARTAPLGPASLHPSPVPSATDAGHPPPSPLLAAVSPLCRLLSQLKSSADPSSAADGSVPLSVADSPLETLMQTATLLLANVLLALHEPSEALQTLTGVRAEKGAHAATASLTASQRLHVDLLTAEAHLQLQQAEGALAALRTSDSPVVAAVLRSCSLASPHASDAPKLAAATPPGEDVAHLEAHVYATAAHALLLQHRHAEATRCIRLGHTRFPADLQLARLSLIAHVQAEESMQALWSVKQPTAGTEQQALF